jgi:hypothetical protein
MKNIFMVWATLFFWLLSAGPAIAGTHQEKDCEGRSYTAQEDLSKCSNGQKSARSKSAVDNTNSSIDNPVKSVIEGGKKLKGLFGL